MSLPITRKLGLKCMSFHEATTLLIMVAKPLQFLHNILCISLAKGESRYLPSEVRFVNSCIWTISISEMF